MVIIHMRSLPLSVQYPKWLMVMSVFTKSSVRPYHFFISLPQPSKAYGQEMKIGLYLFKRIVLALAARQSRSFYNMKLSPIAYCITGILRTCRV